MIFTLQLGGAMPPPLVNYLPIMITGRPTEVSLASTETKEELNGDLTDKDILKMLDLLNGLPSDIGSLTSQLLSFFIDKQYLPINTTSLASRYLTILLLLKTANFNHEMYKDAMETVTKNGGINEFAISDRGLLYCANQEGDFKLLSLEELKNNPDYSPLTNLDLLYYRANAPQMAFNNQLLKVVKNGIGIEAVTKMIQDSIANLGTDEETESGFVRTLNTLLLNGLLSFIKALQESGNYDATVDNLYKGKLLTKSLARQALAALTWIYRTLPINAKTLLKTKTKNQTDEEAVELISTLINSKLSNTLNFELTLNDPDASSSSNKSPSGKSTLDDIKLDPAAMVEAGYALHSLINILTPEGGQNAISVISLKMPITKDKGKSVGVGTLLDIASSDFSGYLDFNYASMGGVPIPFEGMQNIAVDGTSLHVAYLPIDILKYLSSGEIIPDMDMLERYSKALKEIALNNITDPLEINKIYYNNKLPILYSPNGEVMFNYKKFGIINGTALSSAFGKNVSLENYVVETKDENEILNTLAILQKGRGEKDRINFEEESWLPDWLPGTDYTKVYKSTIFIPTNDDYFTASASMGNFPTTKLAELIYARQQSKLKQYINPGTL